MTAHDSRVATALDLLRDRLRLFVETEMRRVHGGRWRDVANASLRTPSKAEFDVQALLNIMANNWSVFSSRLGPLERALVFELREFRNRWAHQHSIPPADVDRILDSTDRLLQATESATTLRAQSDLPGARSAPRRSKSAGHPRRTQRDVMLDIFEKHWPDRDRVLDEYAAAEERGEAVRQRNKHGQSAIEYARALLADGLKKGWLKQ